MKGYACTSCGEHHEDLPFAYSAPAPAFWQDGLPDSVLEPERCVIEGQHFFLRGRLVLPVLDADDDFEWGVWVSVSKDNFFRAEELWDSPERVEEPPYFGWLATELPGYEPGSLNLKTHLHTRPPGERPVIEVESTGHPLAVEQRDGITLVRVQTVAEMLLHP
ncbi:hypothetical protein SAMN05421837_10384 [Amycolatopsis pretoriensis]|uniref:DUF2199 domain-containing protein n=1 Tax=Amycolatopsis pretoriensis TaxID=218821 RepID=A0A1H5QJ59_9PSEU|nr:DUF2199 domain-containing protein [Amycolatopsis pretoriensis]SEF26106.1 hypothetical protein SAMN05421837_10384 [Amycolatopsis pretoriensis]